MIKLNASSALILSLSLTLGGCSDAPEKTIKTASKGLYSAALSNNSELALIGSISHGASLWDIKQGARLFDWSHQPDGSSSDISAAAFSANGQSAVTAELFSMTSWDTRSGQAVNFSQAPAKINSVALSQDGRYALLGMNNTQASLVDARRGGIKRQFQHQAQVRSVDLSADGKFALTGSDDRSAKLWSIKDGKLLYSWPHQNEVRLVRLSPDNKLALTVSKYDKAAIWDTSSGKLKGTLAIGQTAMSRGFSFASARFSDDSRLLLTGNNDRMIELWATKNFKRLERWELPKPKLLRPTPAAILDVSFAGNKIYAISSNGDIHRYALKH